MPGHGSTMRADRQDGRGFTLVELLVAVSVVVILIGLSMPMLTMAKRVAGATNTRSLLQKVDAALGLFRNDAGGYPYVPWSTAANAPPLSDGGPPANRLAYHLGHDMTSTEMADLRADIDAAGTAYESGGSACIPAADINQPRSDLWSGDITAWTVWQGVFAAHLNKLAKTWATGNVMVGNVSVRKPVKNGSNPWKDGTALIANPRSRGFASDYLGGDLPARNVAGDDLLDMWGRQLVYVCPVSPGTVGYTPEGSGSNQIAVDWFGFAPRSGRAATSDLDSDVRTQASARFVYEPELWSAGPDGRFESHRPELANRDNIAPQNYQKGLR